MASMDAVVDAARKALSWDPNEETRAQIEAMLEANDTEALKKAFGQRIGFGTAGLRGPMAPGQACMNDLTVLQACQGLYAHLESTYGQEKLREMGVVFGYDHRKRGSLTSEGFALLSAAIFLSKGVKVYLFSDIVPTPFVPFALSHYGCAAGVMVTASHNPKEDNGYKVYWTNGSQIIPPHDVDIAACIEANIEPWAAFDRSTVRSDPRCVDPTKEVEAAYFTKLRSFATQPEANASTTAKFVYTAMHGVGTPSTLRALREFGFPDGAVVPVPEQCDPDPTFPSVPFPNPEEGKGALQLSMAKAAEVGATVVLANDPDADRLAVAELLEDGQWHIFTGNETAAMLGHWVWSRWRAEHPDADPSTVYFLASTVSSKMLRAVADREGFRFEETLTGFKWMGARTAELEAAGSTVLFAFEEAIGFCVRDLVRDKDGVCAAAVFAEMVAALAARGQTAFQYLRQLQDEYGYFVTNNSYVYSHDQAATDRVFAAIRNEGRYLLRVGDFVVENVRDLTKPGLDTSAPDGRPTLPVSSSHMVTFTLRGGAVFTLRTSGTEPKIKWYAELPSDSPEKAREQVDQLAEAIVTDLLQPEKNGLQRRGEA